jgi:class 3 adenylate cyclase/tetratricopeptide (TPR) repeat protein
VTCPSCGTENAAGKKFCTECGTPLALACANCGAPLAATEKFCGECGTPVAERAGPTPMVAAPVEAPVAERRLVSVLFADLVGFTTLSESRDAEEVRDLLSRYFDTSRTLITRYGGTVEKFIGDAVMAVWGTPVAQEDDAERAVRAALDLVDAVAVLGEEVGAPHLRARAGVLTGEAAVTIGAEAQGMVAGDLVNTASRIQSAAEPGSVFVGEVTRRASQAAIAYEDAGVHELKGKAEPVSLWRALRVVAGAGGALKSEGLEAPFAGRDRELRLVKELFHASGEERKAQLVSITGVAGVGKSRLMWEFFKYMDGLPQDTWWHRGRCLAYGEGVAYWALAEMVRGRAEILEGEDPSSALPKLRATVEEHVPDPEERRWVEPRLAHLLGLEERATGDREDLFAAWRRFFERLAEQDPVVMAFEDMQWADQSLLDFIEYLLEWSRSHPIFVLAMARPELAERRPGWAAARRGATPIYLDPLPPDAMEQLLQGLVPGLPEELHGQIMDRAEGVPLYAVETVRMLLDRGLLAQEGNVYRPTGPIEALDVPETLHALIAARLDGLASEERRLLQGASVLGKVFARGALAAVTGLDEPALDPILTSLGRKEVLSIQADPRSPERGQYGFLQELVRRVAYETLSKKERKARHLAAAGYLQSRWGRDDDEVVEVVASHLLEAYRAAPDADDAADIMAKARDALVRAGNRAASLAATGEAQAYYDQAADLAEDPARRAELLERAGQMAQSGGRAEDATARFEAAIALFEAEGSTHPAARVSARLAEVMWDRGRLKEALDRMDRSFQVLSEEEPDADLAALAAQLGRFLFFAGETDLALARVETALDLAEALWLPEVFSQALNTKGIVLMAKGRLREAVGLMEHALEVALDNDISFAALRAHYNLAELMVHSDRYRDAIEQVRQGVALARKVGSPFWEWSLLGQLYGFVMAGEWAEALSFADQLPRDKAHEMRGAFLSLAGILPRALIGQGKLSEARQNLELLREYAGSDDVQERADHALGEAILHRAEGKPAEAVQAAERALDARDSLGLTHELAKEAFVEAVEASIELSDPERAERWLSVVDGLPPGRRPQFLVAQAARLRARLAQLLGRTDGVEPGMKTAAGMFRELGAPFWLGVTLLEHGEWLASQGRAGQAGPLLDEAHEIFHRLEARPWLERLEKARAGAGVTA